MNVKNVLKNFFYLDEDDNDREYNHARDQQAEQAQITRQQQQTQIQNAQQQQQLARQQANQQKRDMKKREQQKNQPMATPLASTTSVQRKAKKQMPAIIDNDFINGSNLVSFTQKTSKVILFEPRVYSEAQDIGDCLKNKKAAVINLQRIDKAQGKRIIDFLSGAIFALNGDIKKIGEDIFLCTPDNVEVDGNISENYFDE
ncbi:cell division protein SepF [Kurthia sibirica]|uniref:Cell division protein SepF n=1 Tax=Kurthia sibirica TaxID=202750 RepID=A0A2U3AQJ7_9BACL|nr:cell division protein SepF [Kurthia sibirica]PWI26822.1 hypothetical protein DEX24_00555 [Kurthia sibirica]GEK32641.1 hypothetical protein KSI01_01740 [Kurthia sibirica]